MPVSKIPEGITGPTGPQGIQGIQGPVGAQANRLYLFPHTFAVTGEIKVPSGDAEYIPGFYVPAPTGQTVRIMGARARINSGTSVTYKLQLNDVDVPGSLGLTAVPAGATTTLATPLAVGNEGRVNVVVTAVAGIPKNLSITVYLEYSV